MVGILDKIVNFTKIDLNFENEERIPPLQLAVKNRSKKAAEVLLSGNCDVNFRNSKDQSTALHIAALQSNKNMVVFLLDNGANTRIENCKRMVPNGITTNIKIIKILSDHDYKMEQELLKKKVAKRMRES